MLLSGDITVLKYNFKPNKLVTFPLTVILAFFICLFARAYEHRSSKCNVAVALQLYCFKYMPINKPSLAVYFFLI